MPRSSVRRKALRTRIENFKVFLSEQAFRLPDLKKALAYAGVIFSPNAPDGKGLGRLHKLLERQHYRLAFWRVAGHEINYRRFFQINDLAGVRVEQPEVFEATHALILELVAECRVHGLRIDHIDGLYDPTAYLERLQNRLKPHAKILGFVPGRFPVYVEKILGEHETLRSFWPVCGTTGYDALSDISSVQISAGGLDELRSFYEKIKLRFWNVSENNIEYFYNINTHHDLQKAQNYLNCKVSNPL